MQDPIRASSRNLWVRISIVGLVILGLLLAVIGSESLGWRSSGPAAELTTSIPTSAATSIPEVTPSAGQPIVINERGAAVDFPNSITFNAHVAVASGEVEQVVLEYGVDRLTCGTVTAKAFPELNPDSSAEVGWTWEMRQSGSEPPGARIWYRWRVTDSLGNEQVSALQQVTWIDTTHAWRQASRGMVTVHWYAGDESFAETLLDAADESLGLLASSTGVTPEEPIDLYIYADTSDMRDAILYEPGWTGGQAFPTHDVVIIGISPEQLSWGKRTVAHELTHILVGHRTFSCLTNVPTWLNEGIAVYGEGGLEAGSQAQLEQAIAAGELISVQALSGNFSEHPDRADLSYSQSYSLVNYLIEAHGQEQLLALFDALGQGAAPDAALRKIYGFGLDGLEDNWRAAVGAPPRSERNATPVPTALPTPVPTYRPAGS